jgi:2-dehydro-3-deoxygluconokinase
MPDVRRKQAEAMQGRRARGMRVAAIGECMVEFYRRSDGLYVRNLRGDTLNAAVYLARLGVPVDFVTALGDDSYRAK